MTTLFSSPAPLRRLGRMAAEAFGAFVFFALVLAAGAAGTTAVVAVAQPIVASASVSTSPGAVDTSAPGNEDVGEP
jgi:hypothetical protein